MTVFSWRPAVFAFPLLWGTFMLGGLGFAGLSTAVPYKMWTGGAFLLALAWLVSWALRKYRAPALRISEDELEIARLFSAPRHVKRIAESVLVVCPDWIEIREPDRQGFTVGRGHFHQKDWNELLSELRALPFKEII